MIFRISPELDMLLANISSSSIRPLSKAVYNAFIALSWELIFVEESMHDVYIELVRARINVTSTVGNTAMRLKFKVILYSTLRHATCAHVEVCKQCIEPCKVFSVEGCVILTDLTDCT